MHKIGVTIQTISTIYSDLCIFRTKRLTRVDKKRADVFKIFKNLFVVKLDTSLGVGEIRRVLKSFKLLGKTGTDFYKHLIEMITYFFNPYLLKNIISVYYVF